MSERTLMHESSSMVLEEFINQIHESRYDVLFNNCLRKAYRIVREARKLRYKANLAVCITYLKHSPLLRLPLLSVHFYAVVGGKKIDVTYDPNYEAVSMTKDNWVQITRAILIPRIYRRMRMSRKTWALATAIIGLVMTCFFWTEAIWWFWPSTWSHTVTIVTGGCVSLVWSLVYFFSKP